MKVYRINQKVSGNQRLLESINCSLSSDDLLVIKTCLEKSKKFDNEVLESCRFNIVESLISIVNA